VRFVIFHSAVITKGGKPVGRYSYTVELDLEQKGPKR
jgi:hypothetical protein